MARAMSPRPQEEEEEHWQVGKSLPECNLHMLEHNFSDVTFKIINRDEQGRLEEPVYIPALQTLLLARSPVFSSMFRGDLAQKTEQPVIDIHDIDPQAFTEMLRFIYTDNVNLTPDNVMAVLYASKKYIITNLTKRCIQFLQEILSTETAPLLLDQSIFFNEKELKGAVLDKIEKEASTVLSSQDFIKLSKEALHEVLQLNLKITKELEVFEAAMAWAENKCQEFKKSTEGANLREVLGDNIFLIRFPVMSVDDFHEAVVPRDVLTYKEGFQVLQFLTAKSKPESLPFPTEARIAVLARSPITCRPRSPINCLPRRLLIPSDSPDDKYEFRVTAGNQDTLSTNLNCRISKPVLLNKILLHGVGGVVQTMTVTMTQYGNILHSCTAHRAAAQHDVDINAVHLHAGEFQLLVKLALYNPHWRTRIFSLSTSTRSATCAYDDYTSINFDPVSCNLLRGFEYTPVAYAMDLLPGNK